MSLPTYVTPRKVPYFRLAVGNAFAALSPKEQQYAHHMATASWHGTTVCAAQVSRESPSLLRLMFDLFAVTTITDLKAETISKGIPEDDVDKFVEYAALLYSNMGNYLSAGDSKFIPAVERPQARRIVEIASVRGGDTLISKFDAVAEAMYSPEKTSLTLGFPPDGVTGYYGEGVQPEEAKTVDDFLTSVGIEMWNTYIEKKGDAFIVHFASSESQQPVSHTMPNGKTVTFSYGTYHQEHFGRIVESLVNAQKAAANDHQRNMIAKYIDHFRGGDINEHKQSQRHWVLDKGPVVETNMGFIETYRDPRGVRGEWEGFVAIVDKKESRMYGDLVSKGEDFVSRLPWGPLFETDKFRAPDFTSLQVLAFASSGVPLGICIPNYNDVRSNDGFKNVYLANSVAAINFDDKLPHLSDDDWGVYKNHFFAAMSVNVGVHELLGHGTGKLFQEHQDGSLNFDPETVNPLTKEKVDSWYKPGETWGSVFGQISNAYEECRAEAVALYLALEDDVMEVFRQTSREDCDKTAHVLWLNMIRAGVVGLEYYSVDTKQWRQAHMRARFAILQTLLQAPSSIVSLEHNAKQQELIVKIDPSRIRTDGKQAIGELLRHLNINKALADKERGTAFFENLTTVTPEFESLRETVMEFRKPRKQFVQSHSRLNKNGEVELLEFEPTAEGAVAAMVTRHTDIPL